MSYAPVYSRGVTIAIGNFQFERIDVSYPFSCDTPAEYEEAKAWVHNEINKAITQIIDREKRNNNVVYFPIVGDDGMSKASETESSV